MSLAFRASLAALLAAALAPSLGLAWPWSSKPGVVALKKSDFKAHLRNNPKTLLKFYAPWCGHCKEMAPHFEEAAVRLHPKGVSLAKVDATEEPDVAKEYGVESYPTVIWLEDGERTAFAGERTADGIVEWVGFMTRPPVEETAAPAEPAKLPRIVLRGPSLLEGYLAAAKVHRLKASWYFVKDASSSPKVTLDHKGEDPIEMTESPAEKDAVMAFFAQHSVPLFGVLDGETFARYDGRGLIWSLFPMQGGLADLEAEHRPMMMEVAKRFVGTYSVTYTDTDAFKENIDGMLGVKEFPAIVVQPAAGSKTKYVHRGTMTAEAIIQFLEEVQAGKVEPSVKSEPVPTSNDEAVRVIVGSNLQEEAFRDDKDVLVEIYAPWCGACKALWPEYKKLATYVRNWELTDLVTVAKIDATANDIVVEGMAYSSFPTLYFVPAGSKTPIKMEAERNAKAMWKWIKEKSSKAAEIKATQARVKAKKSSQDL